MKKELDARKVYDKVMNADGDGHAEAEAGRGEVRRRTIAKKYPDTPTGKKAEELQKELGA